MISQNGGKNAKLTSCDRQETDINDNCLREQHSVERQLENQDDAEATLTVDSTKEDYKRYLRRLKQIGSRLRADQEQPKISASSRPSWFDESLFKHASSVYERHFMAINFAHLSGLLLLVRVDSIYRTLSATGESDSVAKLFKRYYHTVRHVKTWYECDIFNVNGNAYKSLLLARGMHNKVSSKFNDRSSCKSLQANEPSCQPQVANPDAKLREPTDGHLEQSERQVHLSEYDIMITQFAFIGFIITQSTKMGLIDDFSKRDLDSVLHFWRVIGYYLGASEQMNLCSYELQHIVGLCGAITEMEYIESMRKNPLNSSPGIMSVNIVRSVKFIPMLTIYGIMRYLYELLDFDLTEIEHKRSWFTSLSHTLIKLVMSTLLAYRPFRSFNNGMLRLSFFLVGKIENWFTSRLVSKYGQEGLRS